MSPISYPEAFDERVLLATSLIDRLVPLDQARSFADAIRFVNPDADVTVLELDGGVDVEFVHAWTTTSAAALLTEAQDAVAQRVLGAADSL